MVGFPHGANVPAIKEREAVLAVDDGAVELDVVINIGALRAGELGYVRDELASLIYAVAPTPVKVILETAYLTPEQVEAGCRVAVEARAAFVKNGTGFSPRGAEPGEIALMRRVVGDTCGSQGRPRRSDARRFAGRPRRRRVPLRGDGHCLHRGGVAGSRTGGGGGIAVLRGGPHALACVVTIPESATNRRRSRHA